MPTIESTIEFIKKAHEGQVDKAGKPYYLHSIAVLKRLPPHADDTIKMAALLHDVLEDTTYTRNDLLGMGYSGTCIEIVELLTSSPNQNYLEKIQSIIASANYNAMLVKFADLLENTDPGRMALLPVAIQGRLKEKYRKPLCLLFNALQPNGWAIIAMESR